MSVAPGHQSTSDPVSYDGSATSSDSESGRTGIGNTKIDPAPGIASAIALAASAAAAVSRSSAAVESAGQTVNSSPRPSVPSPPAGQTDIQGDDGSITSSLIAPAFTIDSSNVVAATHSSVNLILGSVTLTPGAAVTIFRTTFSLASSGSVIIRGKPQAVVPVPISTSASVPAFTFGSSVVTAINSKFVVASQKLPYGGVITVSGTTLSLPVADSSVVVVNGQTQALGQQTTPLLEPTVAPELTIGTQTITANSASHFAVYGSTLSIGGAITIALSSNVANSVTVALTTDSVGSLVQVVDRVPATLMAPMPSTPPVIRVGGKIFTADSASHFVINGSMLSAGATITILPLEGVGSATAIALATDSEGYSVGVVNGVSSILTPSTSSSGLGEQICRGIGGCGASTSSESPPAETYTGAAHRSRGRCTWLMLIWGALLVGPLI